MTVLPDRLTVLDSITLDKGPHSSWEDGHCAMEVAAYIAGEPPACCVTDHATGDPRSETQR